MYSNLQGKKLLILGGMKMACDLVRRAQEMGVYVIVADFNHDSPAKLIADKAVYIDATDVDALEDLCKKEKINGVTTGYVDLLLPYCYELAKRMNFPYYATKNMIDVSTNKELFKEMCIKFQLPFPETFEIDCNKLDIEAKKLSYPVFVKPLDASGSRGASVCNTTEEFIENYKRALVFSKNKKVIVEEYLTGTDFILDYIIVNGEPHLLSMFDRLICDNRPSAVNHANLLISPSKALDNYMKEIHPKVVKAFKEMNFNDGLIFLQGYNKNDKITFFEMGCRLGGTFPEIVEYFTKLNPMKLLINYALTGKMLENQYTKNFNPFFNGTGLVINLLTNKAHATVSKINGLEEIIKLPNVLNCIQYLYEGDEYDLGTQTDKPVAILYIASSNLKELLITVKEIYDLISVEDEIGENLLMPVYPIENFDY